MKTLHAGDPKIALWWIGQEIHCPHCTAVYQLEKGDYHHSHTMKIDAAHISIACQSCMSVITKERK